MERKREREGGRGGESVRWLVRVSRMCRLRTLQSRDSIMSACARFVIVITGICISSDESLWPWLCFVSWHADLSCTVIVDARYNQTVLHETDLRWKREEREEINRFLSRMNKKYIQFSNNLIFRRAVNFFPPFFFSLISFPRKRRNKIERPEFRIRNGIWVYIGSVTQMTRKVLFPYYLELQLD